MKTIKQHHFHNTQGSTLISILIGLLISILGILVTVGLYKNLIHVAAETKVDASHDGQMASALLTAQIELSRAGWDIIDYSGEPHVVSNANNILWRYREGESGPFICKGLQENLINGARTLSLIAAQNGCSLTVNLNNLTWLEEKTIAVFNQIENNTINLFSFSIDTGQCTPFGVGTPKKSYVATISAMGSSDYYEAIQGQDNINTTQYDFCLASTNPS